MTLLQLDAAREQIDKLPSLGPAMWLFARDPVRRFSFMADIDWRLMPPLVLDQCQLFARDGVRWAFVTWARVSEAVGQRLRTTAPVIAPREWKSGDRLWLIDVVSPLEEPLEAGRLALREIAGASMASGWLPTPMGASQFQEVAVHG